MKRRFTVQKVEHASEAHINTSVQIFCNLMYTDLAAISLSGGDPSVLKMQGAAILRAGALAGEYYTATNEIGEMIGFTLWMPPGQELFSTDEQRALGLNEYMACLSDKGKEYFKTEYLARFPEFVNSHLGPTGKKDAWWLHMAMVRPDYQRQGVLRAMFSLVQAKASSVGDTLACTTTRHENVPVYLALGFTHRGSKVMPSPWGDWTAHLFSLDTRMSNCQGSRSHLGHLSFDSSLADEVAGPATHDRRSRKFRFVFKHIGWGYFK